MCQFLLLNQSAGARDTADRGWLAAAVAAAGLAQINALSTLSGFFCNFLIGWIKDETGSFPLALMPIAALALAGTISVLMAGRGQARTVAVRQ